MPKTLFIALVVAACGGSPTTQSYDGAAVYSGARTGASTSAHVVVSELAEDCDGARGPCVAQAITITTDACVVKARIDSLQDDGAVVEGFTALIAEGQVCTLGPETITIQTGTVRSTFSTLALDITGTTGRNASFEWAFSGSGG